MQRHAQAVPPRLCQVLALVASLAASPAAQTGARQIPNQWFDLEITELDGLHPQINAEVYAWGSAGGVLNIWRDPLPNWSFAELVKPVPNGNLLAMVYDRATAGLQSHKALVELDWQGRVVFAFDPTPLGLTVHHDFERLPNGNTLVIARYAAVFPTINPNPIWDDVILEVDPAGTVIWAWSTAEHYHHLPLSAAGRAYLYVFPGRVPKAVFHLNSVQSLPSNPWAAQNPAFTPGNLLVSLRDTNLVLIIERPSGRIVWSFNDAIAQHHPRMIPAGLPGAGNILIYDNGGLGGAPPVTRPYTQVIEIDPLTRRVVWQHRSTEFCNHSMGGAQRLSNGNTLITHSNARQAFEVEPTGRVAWSTKKQQKLYRWYRVPAPWRSGEMRRFIW